MPQLLTVRVKHQGGRRAGQHGRIRSYPIGEVPVNEPRKDVLDLLAEGKITASDAESLIAALEPASRRWRGASRSCRRARRSTCECWWTPSRTASRVGSTCGCRCNCCGPVYSWRP